MPQIVVFSVVKGLHNLFSAIWIGGIITLGLTMMPAARNVLGPGPQLKQLMEAVQRRLSRLIYLSIIVLVVTGMLEARVTPAFQGLFSFGGTYSMVLAIKHVLVIVMIIVALYRSLVLGRQKTSSAAQEKLGKSLMLLNIILGIAILFLSGMNGALSALPPS